jgi:8-oxo-dGTP pyrophosphatase MutT (NUDIX family)
MVEPEKKKIPLAVCGLIVNGDKILSVNRVKKTGIENDWNLPGGKVNKDESVIAALVREVYEETGLVVHDPVVVYSRSCGDDKNPGVTVFAAMTYHARVIAGTLRDSEEGPAAWVTWEQILAPHCTFREYNSQLYERVKYFYPEILEGLAPQ